MQLLIIADDESIRNEIDTEHADALISCGDMPDDVILFAASRIGCAHVLAVKGNHDSSGEFPPPILDLHLTVRTIDGIRFGGFNGSWRYKPRGNFLYEQDEVEQMLAAFPPVDVFIAHNSPRYVHDRDDGVHYGFTAFREYIDRVQPQLFIHGHQHINREVTLGRTQVIGVYGQRRLSLESLVK